MFRLTQLLNGGSTIRTKVTTLAVLAGLGMIIFTGVAYRSLTRVSIGSPLYCELSDSKQLLADTMPPILYVVEAYLSTHMLQDAENETERHEARTQYTQFKKDFRSCLAVWSQKVPTGEIKTVLTDELGPTGEAIFDAVDSKLLPALDSGNQDAITKANNELMGLFLKHREPANRISELLLKQSATVESGANQTVRGYMVQYVSLAGGLLLALSCLAFFTLRSISQTEFRLRDMEGKALAIGRSQAVIEYSMDGAILDATINSVLPWLRVARAQRQAPQ